MTITDDTSLDKLADIADKIFESYNHRLNALTPRDDNNASCCKNLEQTAVTLNIAAVAALKYNLSAAFLETR